MCDIIKKSQLFFCEVFKNKKSLSNYDNFAAWLSDAPTGVSYEFQDPATPTMEGIYDFNLSLLIVITSIVVFVGWLMLNVYLNFFERSNSQKTNFTHSDTFEILWTTTPAIILLSLAAPSFALLYSLDEVNKASINLKIFGHQWYWVYENTSHKEDSCAPGCGSLKWSSYMLSSENIQEDPRKKGFFRLLESNKRVLLPVNTSIKLLITSVDVLHSWAVPSFGIKVDACPGRLNQANLFIKRAGVFYGQCSEICGINHGFMPIVVIGTSPYQYANVMLRNLYYPELSVAEYRNLLVKRECEIGVEKSTTPVIVGPITEDAAPTVEPTVEKAPVNHYVVLYPNADFSPQKIKDLQNEDPCAHCDIYGSILDHFTDGCSESEKKMIRMFSQYDRPKCYLTNEKGEIVGAVYRKWPAHYPSGRNTKSSIRKP